MNGCKTLLHCLQASKKIAEALTEDPSVFDYDGCYESIQEQKEGPAIEKRREVKKARYIHGLLKQAEERKREDQRLDEKRLIKEREAEMEEYGETEVFLTSGYKKKLMENRKWEEEQRLLAEKEAKEDVTKVGMQSFYSNLLKGNVALGQVWDP